MALVRHVTTATVAASVRSHAQLGRGVIAVVTLELHKSKKTTSQPWYTVIRASNGKILFWTEMYASRQAAVDAGNILLANGLKAKFLDRAVAA
jgi:uncharacterized protein YegP (UPF0339 family)